MKLKLLLLGFTLISLSAYSNESVFEKNDDEGIIKSNYFLFDLSIDTNIYSNYGTDLSIRYKLLKLVDIGVLSGLQVQRYNKSNELKPVFEFDSIAYNVPIFLYARLGYERLSLQPLAGYHFSTREEYNAFSIGARLYYGYLYYENIWILSDSQESLFTFGFQFNNIFNS